MAAVVEVMPEHVNKYRALHANAWPEVLAVIKKAHIQNYSIYQQELNNHGIYLFSYFEYVGDDYSADMKAIAAAPVTQDWWRECKPCLRPLKGTSIEDCWTEMEQVFDLP